MTDTATDTTPSYVVNETIASGLRYSEELQTVRSHPVRYCCLWQEGEEAPVSELEVHSFHQRFGAVAVPAEGIGGVETPPPFRQRGYVRQLLTRVTAGMAQRVHVAFIGDGIKGMYEKFGYRTSLAEGYLSLKLRNLESILGEGKLPPETRILRLYTPADLPGMADLYNTVHAQRPWTHVRQRDWNRLVQVQTWSPGSTALVLVEGEEVVGYAIYKEHFYGWNEERLEVDELAALDSGAALRLLAELAQRCWQLRLSEFSVREPLDSQVGFVARQLSCDYHQSFLTTGGMMGAILQRAPLLTALEPELRRRLSGTGLEAEHDAAFAILQQGGLIADNETLLRLLLGDWSLREAQNAGLTVPPHYTRLCAAWFPGGGTHALLVPYAHKLDRY